MELEELVKLLACPVCKAPVTRMEDDLVCSRCSRGYVITTDGVPIMLSDASKEMVERSLRNSPIPPPRSRNPSLAKRIVRRILTPPSSSLNTSLARIKELFDDNLTIDSKVLFIGGLRKTDKRLFGGYKAVVLDITPDYDIVGDGHQMPFLEGSFDGVVLQAVLEHVPHPDLIVMEARRVLKKGGVIYVSVPFVQTYHYGPLDYQRYTITGIETLLSDFRKLKIGVAAGPSTALAWVLRNFIVSFSDNWHMRAVLDFFAGWLVFPLKFADFYLVRKRNAFVGAAAVYYVGTKVR